MPQMLMRWYTINSLLNIIWITKCLVKTPHPMEGQIYVCRAVNKTEVSLNTEIDLFVELNSVVVNEAEKFHCTSWTS